MKIAIVGAGAMGIACGYYLQLAGAEITFLVRPARVAEMPAQYTLYSYTHGDMLHFSGFEIIGNPADLARESYDFVLLTLDAHSLTTGEGKALLAAIGAAIRNTAAVLIVGAVGVGVRDFAIDASGLPQDRVIKGMVAMAIHKTHGVSLPLHPPTDPAKLAAADFGFGRAGEAGFIIEDSNPEVTRRFVEFYDRNGQTRCFVFPPDHITLHTTFPIMFASDLIGWPDAETLIDHTELWSLATEGVRAIRGLSMHGEAGRAAAAALTPESLAQEWKSFEQAMRPLDYAAFNAYHHGAKVRAADILGLQSFADLGESEGHDMSAIRELLSRLNNSRKE